MSERRPLGARVTLRDVATLAQVSVATVSYALNDTKPVSDDVRRRVRAAAGELGYRGHRVARALRTGQTQSLGLLLPDLTNPFYPALAQAIEARARRRGYALMLVDCGRAPGVERRGLRLMGEHGVDGLVWIPLPGARFADAPPCPTVLVDRPRAGFDTVASDDIEGGRLLGERAVSLGHERVFLLHGPRSATSTRHRRRGFLEAVEGRATVVAELHVPFATTLPHEAREALAHTDATFVACGSDVIAVGALETLRSVGRDVPGDLSVVGFDDIDWAALVTPPLTTVAHAIGALGTTAVDLVLDRLVEPDGPARDLVLPVTLVERASDARRPAKESL